MPDSFFQADSMLPDLARYGDTEQKLAAVQNYLFLLLENLRYVLRNLTPENFNQTELADWVGRNVRAQTVVSNTVITNELYSEYGAIADLTVDRLRTDYVRARRFLDGDTSALDYLRIHDEVIEFVTAETDGAESAQLVVDGRAFYWTDGSMTQMTSERVTAYPVMVYVYEEDVKAAFRFEEVSHYGQTVKAPVLRLGAGDEQGRNYALLYKDTQGLRLLYNDADGKNIGMICGRTGYTDLYGLRRPTEIDFSGWGDGTQDGVFSETLDGDVVNSFDVEFDAQGRPVLFTDGTGHETAVTWESAT
jgi:hypothetical protein